MLPLIFVAILTAVLAAAAVPYAAAGAAAIDIEVIVLMFFGLRKGPWVGAGLGAFFGFSSGLFGTAPLWISIFLYTAAGIFAGYTAKWFYRENLFTFVLMVLCATAFIYFSRYMVGFMFSIAGPRAAEYALRLFLPRAIYTALASVFLFYFLKELRV